MLAQSTSQLDALTDEIAALKSLHERLDHLRRIPRTLVKGGRPQLDVLNGAKEALLGESVQKALARAAKDDSDVQIARTNSKKRCVCCAVGPVLG